MFTRLYPSALSGKRRWARDQESLSLQQRAGRSVSPASLDCFYFVNPLVVRLLEFPDSGTAMIFVLTGLFRKPRSAAEEGSAPSSCTGRTSRPAARRRPSGRLGQR